MATSTSKTASEAETLEAKNLLARARRARWAAKNPGYCAAYRKANLEKCRLREKEYARKHREASKARHRAWSKKNADKLREYQRSYGQIHKDKIREYQRKYINSRPWIARNYVTKRNAAKLKRTPPWADFEQIKLVYKLLPPGHHVDHIIPLQGKTVSGLHVHYNLQYLPAIENIRKGNKL